KPPTRQYTAHYAGPPGPQAPPTRPAEESARFRTSRTPALLWGGSYVAAALVVSGGTNPAAVPDPGARFLAFVVFAVLLVLGLRLLYRVVRRPQLCLRVGSEGLSVSWRQHSRELPWTSIARVRVVEERSRPWLVLWLADGTAVPGPVRGDVFRPYHGGLR